MDDTVWKCRWRAEMYPEFRAYSVVELGRHKLGTRRPPPRRSADLFTVKSSRRPARHPPAEFDARLHWPGWIHPPTDQGACGASWAFSTASQYTPLIFITLLLLYSLTYSNFRYKNSGMQIMNFEIKQLYSLAKYFMYRPCRAEVCTM